MRIVAALAGALALASGGADAQFVPAIAETPVPFTHLDVRTLRIPLLGFERIETEARWAALWERYDVGDSTRRRRPLPTVDFRKDELLVVAAPGTLCAGQALVSRLFVRRDTLHLVSSWPISHGRPCYFGPGSADAVVVARTKLPIRPVYNAMYTTLLTDPWWEHRTVADLDTIADRDAREGWFEMLAREDSSIENLRRLAPKVRSDGATRMLFKSARLRGDRQALSALVSVFAPQGGLDTLVHRFGLALARDPTTPRAMLDRLLYWVSLQRSPHQIAAAIFENPSVVADPAYRERLADSGLLPGGAVVGTVRDSAGTPRAELTVVIAGLGREATTTYRGAFRILGLRPGPARLVTYLTPVDSAEVTVTIGDRDTARWDPVIADHYSTRQRPTLARYPGDDVDSAGRGLLKVDTSRLADFRTFSERFVSEAMRRGKPDENRVLSPFGVAMALALTSEGARGATATAFATTLGIDHWSAGERSRRIGETLKRMQGRVDVQLAVASAVWLDAVVEVTPAFRRTAETDYGAVVKSMSLATQAAARVANHWADSVTFGRIPVIQNGPFDAGMRAVLANAVYFNGAWLDKFAVKETRPRPFTLANGTVLRIPAMEQTKDFGYLKGTGYRATRLPYRAGKTAMYVVLPDRGVTRDELLVALGARWPQASSFSQALVHVQLPRVHVEAEVDLPEILTALGLGTAFIHGVADFRGLGRVTSGPSDLAIGSANQRVFLDVNEEGTEAAAVTVFGMTVTSAPEITQFVVDRPFLFVLRDESIGAYLFVGWIAKP